MQFVIRTQITQRGTLKFCMPRSLPKKYGWVKEAAYMIQAYSDSIFIVEPVDMTSQFGRISSHYNKENPVFYCKPLAEYAGFGFYIPTDIAKKLNLLEIRLLAVHDSGAKPIFLEAFPNGTQVQRHLPIGTLSKH